MNNIEKFNFDDNLDAKNNKPKKKKTKTLLVILFLIITLGFSITYLYLNTNIIQKTLNKFQKKEPTVIKEEKIIYNEVKYELGAELKKEKKLYINNFSNIDKVEIDLSNIPVDDNNKTIEVGEFQYIIKYDAKELFGKITVVDTTKPSAYTKTAYVSQGEKKITPNLFLRNIIDNSSDYVAEITNLDQLNTNELGSKEVLLKIKDVSENFIELKSQLIVLDSSFSTLFDMQDLNVSYNDQNDLEWTNVITEKFASATNRDSLIYKEALVKINEYNWINKVQIDYPNAIINSQDLLIMYNQNDLIVGITKRINLTINGETKNYYLNY